MTGAPRITAAAAARMLSRLSARFLNLAGTRAAPACRTAASMAGVRRAISATVAMEALSPLTYTVGRSGPAGSHPLPMSLQHGVSFRGFELVGRGKAFQCPELAVLVHGYHVGSLATWVNDVMLVEDF